MTRFSLIILASFLAACASAPGPRTDEIDVDYPDSWAAEKTAQAGVDRAWIDRFKDSRLIKLIDEAVENNPDIKATAARIERAEGEARRAGAAMKPQLEASLFGQRQKQNFIGFPFGDPAGGGGSGGASSIAGSLTNTFGISLAVDWELDVWGRVRQGVSGAIADTQAAQADLRAAQTSLAAQVSKAWFALLEANQQVTLSKAAVEVFTETEDAVRERFETGQVDEGGSAANLRLAMSDTAAERAELERLKENAARAVRQLETLLGRYPKGALAGEPELPEVPAPPPAGLPSELLLRRPDILAAERRFAASGARRKESVRAFFPRFALTSSVGSSTEDLNDVLNSDFGVWSLAGNVAQPIYQGDRLRAELAIRKAEEKERLALLQNTVLKGFNEVETSLAVEKFLTQREIALAEAARLAKEADDQARADYRDGVGDFLTVLTTQTRLLRALSSKITVRRLRLENRINLHLALGGDFRPRTP